MSDAAGVDAKPNRMSELARKRWDKKNEDDAARNAVSGGEPHALFPTEEGEPVPDIRWIDIIRYTPGVGPVQCPRSFPAPELDGLEQLLGMFGGGVYELRGRAAAPTTGRPGPILRVARYTLEGDPIPFSGEQAVSSAAPGPSAPAQSDPMALMFAMMQENARESRAASERQMQMIVAMMQGQASSQAESMRSMVALIAPVLAGGNKGTDVGALLAGIAQMSSAQFQQVSALLPKETTDPMDRLTKLLDLAKGLNAPKEETIGDILGGAAQAVGALAALEEMKKQGQAPANSQQQQQPQQTTEPPPPPQQPPPARFPGEASRIDS